VVDFELEVTEKGRGPGLHSLHSHLRVRSPRSVILEEPAEQLASFGLIALRALQLMHVLGEDCDRAV
jgi:hypothetical protein